MLQNDFYKLLNTSENTSVWSFDIELNASHRIYEGHFPEQPIVPGVCTLQIIRECAEGVLQKKTNIIQISSCKYLAVVNPVVAPIVNIQLSLKQLVDGEYMLLAEGTFGETSFIKLKATLKAI